MGESGRKTLMSLAGVYLVYVGGKLFLDAMREKPGNYIFMMIMGIIFVVFGAGTVIMYMRGAFKREKIQEDTEASEAPAEAEEEITEEASEGVGEQAERKEAVYVNLADMYVDEPGEDKGLETEPVIEGMEDEPADEISQPDAEEIKAADTENADTEDADTEDADSKEITATEVFVEETDNEEESEIK